MNQIYKFIIVLLAAWMPTLSVSFANASSHSNQEDFRIFKPNPQNNNRLDFSLWDDIVYETVINTGFSDRIKRARPDGVITVRSKRSVGHKSPYRAEGNRILASRFPPDLVQTLTSYRKDLEQLTCDGNITKFPKNEQLAFWLNLHNLTVMEQIALNYPFRYTNKLQLSTHNQPLDTAPLLSLCGLSASLKDIRENIVYSNWNNPIVIYGFFTGDIGSPIIHNKAFSGENVGTFLKYSASEFTNSLRGFDDSQTKQRVSELYVHVAPYYFPNFDQDLKNHFKSHMRSDVFQKVNLTIPFLIGKYYYDVASVSAGRNPPRLNNQVLNSIEPNNPAAGIIYDPEQNSALVFFIRELRQKRQRLRVQGLSNEVIIEDIVTDPNQQLD